jgi:hypothetical protein
MGRGWRWLMIDQQIERAATPPATLRSPPHILNLSVPSVSIARSEVCLDNDPDNYLLLLGAERALFF